MATIGKYLQEFGATVEIPCRETLRAVAYQTVSFGHPSGASVSVENVLMALCREVLELGEKK